MWIVVLETACLAVAGVGMWYVYEPLLLMSFLGWETGVFACCCASAVWALLGIYSSMSCGGDAQRSSSGRCFKRFGVLSFYHCFALLFLSLHTFIAQPLSWYEMEKHWGIVSWRFPQFQHLNETDAVLQAGEYYQDTIMAVGTLSVVLLVLTVVAVGYAMRAVSQIVLVAYAMKITSILAAVIGLVLVGVGTLEFRRQEFYGPAARVPLLVFLNAVLWLGVSVIGAYTHSWSMELRKAWCVYFWWLILVLAGAVGCMAMWISYMHHEFEMIDETSDKDMRQANMNSGFDVDQWTREDYKLVLKSHFSPLFSLLTFLVCSAVVFMVGGCFTFRERGRIPKSIQ
jgi:hypothetical protein